MLKASGKGGAALYIYTDLLRTLGLDLTNKKHLKKAKDLLQCEDEPLNLHYLFDQAMAEIPFPPAYPAGGF